MKLVKSRATRRLL